jgi:uncharacterized protein (TIGR02391 family)
MPVSRPIGKEVLKKMIIKALAARQGSVPIEALLKCNIPEVFKIDRLSKEEYAEGYRAGTELDRDGYITQDPDQTHAPFKMLTAQGKKVAAEALENMRLQSLNIDEVVSRDELRSLVRDDYNAGDYETAIFKAFRHLEESVRKKTNQPPQVIGVNLMTVAFRANGGLLKHPEAQVDAEAEALHQLMRGAIGWFKNPSSHRTVGYDDEHQAAHVLGFANLLLDLLDECT